MSGTPARSAVIPNALPSNDAGSASVSSTSVKTETANVPPPSYSFVRSYRCQPGLRP